jgi:hypothetical protein
MNEEVLNGIGIAVSSGSLRERPASDFWIKRVTYVTRMRMNWLTVTECTGSSIAEHFESLKLCCNKPE